jgi:hypothetical protein
MTQKSAIGLAEQLQLRIDKEFRKQLDDMITEMQEITGKFEIQKVQEKSPFRNVLSAATEPMSSIEAIKVFIRYQVGRKESSKVWKLTIIEDGKKKFFADAVVRKIADLEKTCEIIFDSIESDLIKEIEALKDAPSSNLTLQELTDHLKKSKPSLIKAAHLNLTQLFLGYLSREHTALLGFQSDKNSKIKS